ncbi:MAG: putative Ig domain-containing protein [Candidatus Thiodiazotropha sp.]|nr:putative Ig domain-containing protein [Candidatus Thiodiazotropha sp.]MCM8885556.1 putative Ig domain-containing protein [Candidatus Thiodiazotropha sp.]MCM8922009.1 putative Ig domain-containing protein [Candidatus Thiodiazotropha sp.]
MLKTKIAIALTPLLLPLSIQNVSAFGGYGSDVDNFCTTHNSTTPYGDQGCDLCHQGSKGNRITPEWDWWSSNELVNFCGTVAVNEPPVLDPIGNKVVDESEVLQFMVAASDPNGDDLTISMSNIPTGASFNDHGNGTADFSWNPGYNQAGNYPVNIIVNDNGNPAESDSEEIIITVGNRNRPPVLDSVGSRSVNYDESLSIMLTASDPDSDGMTITAANLPTGTNFFDNGDGTAELDWIPTIDQIGNYPVLFAVSDDGDPIAAHSEEITITVGGTLNRPPVLDPVGNRSANVDETLEITLTSSDPDGDNVSFIAEVMPSGASLDDNGNGMARFHWTPTLDQAGNHTVSLKVTDDGVPSESDSEDIVITVGGIENRPPTLAPIGNRSLFEGESLEIMLTANDPDGIDNLSFSIEGLPGAARFMDNGDGTAMISWTPVEGDAGEYTVVCTVMDEGMPVEADTETFTLSVKPKIISDQEIYVHKAKVSLKKKWLSVKGKDAPAKTEVIISDAENGHVYGSVMSKANGKWRYRGPYGEMPPCRIHVEAAGLYAEMAVSFKPKHKMPASCGNDQDEDDNESHDNDHDIDRDNDHDKDHDEGRDNDHDTDHDEDRNDDHEEEHDQDHHNKRD